MRDPSAAPRRMGRDELRFALWPSILHAMSLRTPARALARVLLGAPLLALPITAFIWLRDSGSPATFGRYYALSLVFVFSGWLGLWVMQHFVFPRLMKSDATGTRTMALRVAAYGTAMVLGFAVAALILNATLAPDLLRNPRDAAVVGMYGLVFITLSLGIGFALALYRRVEERVREDQELLLARRIQRSFLPARLPQFPAVQIGGLNVPSRQVSGDLFDVVPAGDSSLLIAVADVAGKGMPAALLSSMLQASLRTQSMSNAPVARILSNINALIYRHGVVEQFATFFLARLDLGPRRLSYANAGHNYPVLFPASGGRVSLDRGGPMLGILESVEYEETVLMLAAGDRLLIYTDGLTEAANARHELFGEERLCQLVESFPATLSCDDAALRAVEEARRFAGAGEPADDMTLILLRMQEEGP